MPSLMAHIRRLVYGRRDPSIASEAFRNIGQLELTGNLAQPLPFHDAPEQPIDLDQEHLPWELREDRGAES
jgi:hypothetical protein